MAFWDNYFIFNGIPCAEYGLRPYEVNGVSPGDGSFPSPAEISEGRISGRYKPLLHGITQNEPLTLKVVFGADKSSVETNGFLDAWNQEAVNTWLPPVDGYKWLKIEQADMEQARCRYLIENLQMVKIGNLSVAFSCTVQCDSPFAYQYPVTYSYNYSGNTNVTLRNLGSYCGGYQPKIKITLNGSNTIKIINHSDNDRVFALGDLPQDYFPEIEVDNENGVITNDMDLSLYPYFNFEFFKLVHGDSLFEVIGNCMLEIQCKFPINVGD